MNPIIRIFSIIALIPCASMSGADSGIVHLITAQKDFAEIVAKSDKLHPAPAGGGAPKQLTALERAQIKGLIKDNLTFFIKGYRKKPYNLTQFFMPLATKDQYIDSWLKHYPPITKEMLLHRMKYPEKGENDHNDKALLNSLHENLEELWNIIESEREKFQNNIKHLIGIAQKIIDANKTSSLTLEKLRKELPFDAEDLDQFEKDFIKQYGTDLGLPRIFKNIEVYNEQDNQLVKTLLEKLAELWSIVEKVKTP